MKIKVIQVDGNYEKKPVGPLIEQAFIAWQNANPNADTFLPDVTVDYSAGGFGHAVIVIFFEERGEPEIRGEGAAAVDPVLPPNPEKPELAEAAVAPEENPLDTAPADVAEAGSDKPAE